MHPRLVLALVLLAACDQAKEAAKKADHGLDSMQLDEVKASVTSVKANLAAGKDSLSDCAVGLRMSEDVGDSAEAKALVAELRTLCNHDVPLASATRAVVEAEQARAARPAENPLSECYSAAWDTAVDKLDRDSKADAPWTALKERWAKACPPM
jgi:hypothetical protein